MRHRRPMLRAVAMPLATAVAVLALATFIGYTIAMTSKNRAYRSLMRRGDPFPGADRLRKNVADR